MAPAKPENLRGGRDVSLPPPPSARSVSFRLARTGGGVLAIATLYRPSYRQ